MGSLSQGIMEKGIAKGVLNSIKGLVRNTNVSYEQAMSLLDVPEEDRPKYMKLLEDQ